jgi:hypothetical protein
MSWLEQFGVARIIRIEYEQMRKLLRELRDTPPAATPPTTMCRRCGCDTLSCRTWGCIPQGEPMSEDRLRGLGDATSAYTHYTDRMRG